MSTLSESVLDCPEWEGRFPGAESAFGLAVPMMFRWRHRQLRRIFARV
ncbi:MAG: hypothetical protein AAGF92_14480 [Myxococcota bacterium]